MNIHDVTLSLDTEIEVQSYFNVTENGIIEIAVDLCSKSNPGKGSENECQELSIELQDLVDGFFNDVNEDEANEAIRNLYIMANEFDRIASEFRERAELMEDENNPEKQLELEFGE